MFKKLTPILFLSITIGFSAQEKISEIDSVVVQGKFIATPYKNITQNISIITKADIQKSAMKTIDEVLQSVPGMDIRRRGANGVQSDIAFRGSTFEQVLILINGIRMNDAQTGHNSMNIPVDLDNVERIEIIKGPAARRFGQNAYAGAINIITKPTLGKGAKVLAEIGDYKSYKLGVAGYFGDENFSNSLQINSSESGGYRHNTDFKIRNAYYQNQLKIKNGNIKMQAGFSEKKFGANGFYASPKASEQYEETQASIISFALQKDLGTLKWNANTYWRRGQDMYLFNREKPEIYRNMHIGNTVGGEVNASYISKFGVTGLGVELKKDLLVSNNLGNRNRLITQTFLEHHFSLLDQKLKISPGITYANFSNEGNFFYPGLDVGYQIDKNNKVYGNIAKTTRLASYTELYYLSPTEKGNENLVSESATSAEIGYQYSQSNFWIKTSAFIRNSDNAIDFVKPNLTVLQWNAQNLGVQKTNGVELEANYKFGSLFNFTFGYTYLDTKSEVSKDWVSRYTLDFLKHQVIGKLQYQIIKHLDWELLYRYSERKNYGSYHLLDSKIQYSKPSYKLYFLVNNLTNTNYSETFSVPMPKRWFHVGFSYQFDCKK